MLRWGCAKTDTHHFHLLNRAQMKHAPFLPGSHFAHIYTITIVIYCNFITASGGTQGAAQDFSFFGRNNRERL